MKLEGLKKDLFKDFKKVNSKLIFGGALGGSTNTTLHTPTRDATSGQWVCDDMVDVDPAPKQ
jgi:dihydroxyacid dehydratase/phosphogluconate dehydratase